MCCNTIRLARGRPALYSLCRRYGNVSAFRSDTPEDDPLRSTHLCARMTDAPEHSEKAPLAAESPDVGIPVCVTPYTPSGCGARTPRSVAGRHGGWGRVKSLCRPWGRTASGICTQNLEIKWRKPTSM